MFTARCSWLTCAAWIALMPSGVKMRAAIKTHPAPGLVTIRQTKAWILQRIKHKAFCDAFAEAFGHAAGISLMAYEGMRYVSRLSREDFDR
jgi:hypothetical protein